MTYMPGVYDPPVAHYRHFPLTSEQLENVAKIIGKDGCHFIRITKKARVRYIWFNQERGVVEIWGPHDNLMKAQSLLEKHICNI